MAQANRAESTQHKCMLCPYVYDSSRGSPDQHVPAGTSWDDVSHDWCCPECGASKSDFLVKDY